MPAVTIWHAKWCAPCRATLADLVPKLRDAGVEPEVVDIEDRPCAARYEHIDYLPTVTVTDGRKELLRSRGYPSDEAVEAIVAMGFGAVSF
ncbi:hypothetical protein HMPREF1868_01531 [Olsenella sp. DNF00959]|nr:hypothetical protein HMPREF1868_01531 [Olsenella sp. DNF00959]